MNNGMGTSDLYDFGAAILAAFTMVLSLFYLRRVIHSYRYHHDDRAAVSLAKGIGLAVISLGLLISALGLIFERPELSIAGLSIARGALIALLATLILANVRPQSEET